MSTTVRSTPGLRFAVVGVALAFTGLFVVNTFVRSPASQQLAAKYFSPDEIQHSLDYSYERKLLNWCGVGLQVALLTALVCTTWARRLTDRLNRWTRNRWLLTLLLVGAVYFMLSELLALPLALARLNLARDWNMTTQATSAWLVDYAKGLTLHAAQGAIGLLGLYGLMWLSPRSWWLLAAAGGTALAVLYAFAAPVVIDPLFGKFTQLTDPILRQRVRILAEKANVPVDEILVVDASSRGRHNNAYFTGFGSTRRIVLYDTLLKSHSGHDAATAAGVVGIVGASGPGSPLEGVAQGLAARLKGDDELETILAHEIGHWQHNHIVKGIALAAIAGLIGMFLLSRVLHWAVGRRPFSLTAITDPAGLPLILWLVMLTTWLTMPVQNGIARMFERQADMASLELAGKPDAFIEAEKRIALINLDNLAPAPFNVWMFSTHPPAVERIEMAEKWRQR